MSCEFEEAADIAEMLAAFLRRKGREIKVVKRKIRRKRTRVKEPAVKLILIKGGGS